MKQKTINLQEILLCTAIFLIEFAIFTKNIIFVTNYAQNLINIAIGILLINSIFVLLKIKVNIKQWIIYFILLLLSITSFIKTDDSLLIQLYLIIICSIDIDFKKVIKYDVIFKLILLLFIILSYFGGYAKTDVFVRNGELRYAFGFNQPNAFGYYLLSFFFEFMYINHGTIKLYKSYILFFIIFYLINLASSRASQICICIFIFLYTLYYIKEKKLVLKKQFSKKNNWLIRILKVSFLIFTIFSIIITNEFIKGSEIAIFLDDLLSDRLLLQSIFIKNYDIKLLGNNIFYFDTLDNVYIRTLLNYGIIISLLYMHIYNKIISKATSKKENIILIIVFVFFIYGLMEWYIIRPAINIFLIYFSAKTIENK